MGYTIGDTNKELVKLGRQQAGQNQSSGELPSLLYSSSLTQAHLGWHHLRQALHQMPSLIIGLKQTTQEDSLYFGPGHRSTSHEASNSHRTNHASGFSTTELGLVNWKWSNAWPSPGQFHLCDSTARQEFGTKADSGDVWQSHKVFEWSRAWQSSADSQKKH